MTYTTMQGDTWDLVAFRMYGDETKMGALIEANKAYCQTYRFPAGVVLSIPDLSTTHSSSLPPWRR